MDWGSGEEPQMTYIHQPTPHPDPEMSDQPEIRRRSYTHMHIHSPPHGTRHELTDWIFKDEHI